MRLLLNWTQTFLYCCVGEAGVDNKFACDQAQAKQNGEA
jgi:hypothetical protein